MTHKGLIVSVSVNGSETVVWKEKERVRIRAVQMDNSSGLLDVRIMYRMQKKQVRKLCGMTMRVNKWTDEF